MITIDGQEYEKGIAQFGNLEELLTSATSGSAMKSRTVTDVLVNGEVFSEIYPHQAEDISSELISSVEIRSVSNVGMALDIVGELGKVCLMMEAGARNVARLFRQTQDSNALELFQDLLDVIRDFMGTQFSLYRDFDIELPEECQEGLRKLSEQLTEMSSVMAGEDWILLADLLEYEFLPECGVWKDLVTRLEKQILAVANVTAH